MNPCGPQPGAYFLKGGSCSPWALRTSLSLTGQFWKFLYLAMGTGFLSEVWHLVYEHLIILSYLALKQKAFRSDWSNWKLHAHPVKKNFILFIPWIYWGLPFLPLSYFQKVLLFSFNKLCLLDYVSLGVEDTNMPVRSGQGWPLLWNAHSGWVPGTAKRSTHSCQCTKVSVSFRGMSDAVEKQESSEAPAGSSQFHTLILNISI